MTELEKRALRVVCPLCTAGVGRPCLNMGSVNTDFGRLTLKHPHKERRVKAAKTVLPGEG
jgi:hypothetical protein